MYRTASPYVKELQKGEIEWHSFSNETINKAIKEDKPIFVHIGNISNIEQRKRAYSLFSTPQVIEVLKKEFISIAIDTEDVPEIYLIGMDLLLINEKKISEHINIFSLPGIKPVTSFSSLLPDDFLSIASNVAEAYRNNREKLEEAARYLTARLKNSGRVTRKEEPSTISPKLLHAYIRSWSSRFLDKPGKYSRHPYILNPRNLTFILEYAHRYNVKEYLDYISETLEHVYHSAVFDPIDGGIFRSSADYTFTLPSYEKTIYDNANAAILFTIAHKYLRKKIFKEAAERIVYFLEKEMNLHRKGFITYITLNKGSKESSYYKYSLKELEDAFQKKYRIIAHILGMNTGEEKNAQQTISNTERYWELTPEEIAKLKAIRNRKKGEVIYDKRVMTGYNCRTAIAFCLLAGYSKKGQKEEYLKMAKEIIDNIVNHRKKDRTHLYKYLSPTKLEYSTSDLYDYSLLLNSLLHYYMLTKDKDYLELAKTYTAHIYEGHYHIESGMFNKTCRHASELKVKRAPVIDYNTLSSNSIMADNLLLLHKITKDKKCLELFEQQIYNIQPQLIGSGPFMAGWGMQVLNYLTGYLHLGTEEQ